MHPVAVYDVGVLPCWRLVSGLVALPEYLEEIDIADDVRVIVDLYRLAVIAYRSICGLSRCAAGVSHSGSKNAWEMPEPGLAAPESTERECGGLEYLRRHGINWGNSLDVHRRVYLLQVPTRGRKQGGNGDNYRRQQDSESTPKWSASHGIPSRVRHAEDTQVDVTRQAARVRKAGCGGGVDTLTAELYSTPVTNTCGREGIGMSMHRQT